MIFAILFITLCSASLNAEIYTWTDENGVKHYSNTPPDRDNATVDFKEYKYDKKADKRRTEDENEELESLIKDIEHTDRKEKAAAEKRAAEAKKNQPPTKAERIEAERKRLSDKIVELQELPLEYFGSYDNKRNRIGFYKYRLEALAQDAPDPLPPGSPSASGGPWSGHPLSGRSVPTKRWNALSGRSPGPAAPRRAPPLEARSCPAAPRGPTR